jgi:hypothetical protein
MYMVIAAAAAAAAKLSQSLLLLVCGSSSMHAQPVVPRLHVSQPQHASNGQTTWPSLLNNNHNQLSRFVVFNCKIT